MGVSLIGTNTYYAPEQNRLGAVGEFNMCADKAMEPEKQAMMIDQVSDPTALPPAPIGLEPELQDRIGIQLRAVYDGILNEPVPERFLKLLAELERKQADKP